MGFGEEVKEDATDISFFFFSSQRLLFFTDAEKYTELHSNNGSSKQVGSHDHRVVREGESLDPNKTVATSRPRSRLLTQGKFTFRRYLSA